MTWQLPKLPDLSQAPHIALDIETHDPKLKELGPGVRRGARIIGIAVAVPGGLRAYLPFGHAAGPQYPHDTVQAWAKKELCRPNQPKLGANLLYDLDFLAAWGVPVTGPFYDVQVAEPLLDENRYRYNLNSLSEQYLGIGKATEIVEQACEARGLKGPPQEHLHRLPAAVVGPYAEGDVDRPLRIFAKQAELLKKDDLWDLFMLETRLIPLLLAMRQRGVRIDEAAVARFMAKITSEAMAAQRTLDALAGFHVEINATESVKKAADKLGIAYNMTRKGNPSFTQAFLQYNAGEFGKALVEARRLDKLRGTFLLGHLGPDHVINGRIHCQFNQLRSDDYGTVTGRFSAASPNLTQIPKRDAASAAIRSFFKPEPGELWGNADYDSVELRILAHYARGAGSDEIRKEYNANPALDYHSLCAEISGIPRAHSKTINFCAIYGGGASKIASQLGVSEAEGRAILNGYYAKLPFIKETMNLASRTAMQRGWVRTILNRRRRFNEYEPADWALSQLFRAVDDVNRKDPIAVRDWVSSARTQWAIEHPDNRPPRYGVKRAWAYKAMNAIIQGSAADLLKKAMVDIWESGVCDVLGPPLLTVHDELDWSVPDTAEGREAFAESIRLMETAIAFRVPITVSGQLQKDWGTPLTSTTESV